MSVDTIVAAHDAQTLRNIADRIDRGARNGTVPPPVTTDDREARREFYTPPAPVGSRRWEVEALSASNNFTFNPTEGAVSRDSRSGVGSVAVRVVREIKPITRAQVDAAISDFLAEVDRDQLTEYSFIPVLKRLGIEVVD